MKILFSLIAGHAIADYGLQSAYMATNKRNPIVLLAHSLIHGAIVDQALRQNGVANSTRYAVAEVIAHTAIDAAKSRGWLCESSDQALHVLCKIAIVLNIGRAK